MTGLQALPTLAYEVVDVFSDRAFAGNALAVVLDADDLSTEQLQAIAREFNLSETAFPMAADDGAAYRLRIFTPRSELPFAGHPSVGAAEVMARLGRVPRAEVLMSCGAGLLPVRIEEGAATLTGGEPTWSDPLEAGPLLACVGLEARDLDGVPRRAGCGIDFTFLPVHEDALARAVPDLPAITALGDAGLSVGAWDGRTAHVRVFCPGEGIVEDPATGSAALGYGVCLAVNGLVPDGESSYVVLQGAEVGRPSQLHCQVQAAGGRPVATRVRGDVVPVAAGRIRIPD